MKKILSFIFFLLLIILLVIKVYNFYDDWKNPTIEESYNHLLEFELIMEEA